MADLSHGPNCGTVWTPGATVCPHCGGQPPGSVWPPAPVGGFVPVGGVVPALPSPPRPPGQLITGKAWADLILGLVATLLSSFLGGLGLVVMPILYFVLRPNFPVFARGIGYGLLVMLLLGAVGVVVGILLVVGLANSFTEHH